MTIAAAFEEASGGALGVTGHDVRPLLVDGKTIDELRVEGVVRATGHPFSISSGFSGVSLDEAAAALGRAALAQNPVTGAPAAPTIEQQVVTEPAVLNAVADSIAASAGLRAVARDIREGRLSLIEIKGLSAAVQAAKAGISSVKSETAGLSSEAAALIAAVQDVRQQIKQAHDDLKFEAEQLGNGGG